MREKCVFLTFFFFLFYFTTYADIQIYLSWPSDGAKISPANIQFSWYTTQGTYGLQFKLQITDKNTNEKWNSPLYQFTTNDLYKTHTLVGGKTYYWRVVVENSAGTVLGYSAVNTLFTTGGAYLLVYPTWPNGNTEYTLTPTFYWYADQYPEGIKYQIKIFIDHNKDGLPDDLSSPIHTWPSDSRKIVTNGITNLFYTVPEGIFQVGESYVWQIRGYDPTGVTTYNEKHFGTYSYYNKFTILSPQYSSFICIPTYPCGVNIYSNIVTLYWYYPGIADGITFELEINGPDGYHKLISCLKGFSTQIPCLVPGIYQWRVKVCGKSWSEWYTFTVIGGASNNAIASWPMNSIEFTTRPTLYWYLQGSCSAVTGYIIKYSTINQALQPGGWSAFNPSANNAAGGQKTIGSSAVTYWQIETDLSFGTTYYWAVTTKNNTNYSAGSFSVYGNMICDAIPVLVYPLNESIVYLTSATFVWFVNGSLTGIAQYEIKYVDSPNPNDLDKAPSVFVSPAEVMVKIVNDLKPGHTYYWKVRSLPYTNWSQTWSFTVLPVGCYIVQPCIGGPDNVDLKVNSVVLSWRVPIPAADQKYDVEVADNPDFNNSKAYTNIETQDLQLNGLSDRTYYWKVRAAGTECIATPYSSAGKFVINSSTDVGENAVPSDFNLKQNYPNPFNPVTTIEYSIPRTTHVRLSIYNMLGQEIKSLVDTDKDAGVYRVEWYGDDNAGYKVTSGVYFYKVTSNENSGSRKMILLK